MLSIVSEPRSKNLVSGPAYKLLVLLRIIPEFRTLRQTFHRKSASKYRIRQIEKLL